MNSSGIIPFLGLLLVVFAGLTLAGVTLLAELYVNRREREEFDWGKLEEVFIVPLDEA